MNHPFIDGNKRTSLMCSVAFLNMNGWDLDVDYDKGLHLSIKLTTHAIERAELAAELSSPASSFVASRHLLAVFKLLHSWRLEAAFSAPCFYSLQTPELRCSD